MGLLCFSLLWLRPENFIIPVFLFIFCPSDFSSYLFNHLMTPWEYLFSELCLISLPILSLPMPWSTCCSSLEKRILYLGSPCKPYIADFAKIYAS